MSEPITTIAAFIAAKFSALIWSLGAALITLSFVDESKLNRRRSFLRGLANLLATWFVGFVLGDAINAHLDSPSFTGAVYVFSTTTGLLFIGGLYKFAAGFKDNPQQFISNIWTIWRRK
jgi:hypothetical protein